MDDDNLQGVLVISCGKKKPSELIQSIIGEDNTLVKASLNFEDRKIQAYPWHISTKYYDADLHFLELPSRDLINAPFAKCVEAAVIYFDHSDGPSFQDVQSWMPFIEQFDPEIRILVCDEATSLSAVPRKDVLKWCISSGFELVELYPSQERDEDDDSEDDFQEMNSVNRIIGALHAHSWPHMDMKPTPSYQPSSKFQDALNAESVAQELGRLGLSSAPQEDRIAELVEQDAQAIREAAANEESFENLFSKFQEMKEKASHLSRDDRRQYAERTVVAFWEAMGGEEEEVAGLDSD